MSSTPRREVTFLHTAKADIGRLNDDDPTIARLALRKVQELQAGIVTGVPLEAMARTGDLGDCSKLYFGPGNPPSHRIVYRAVDGDPSRLEVLEVIAVESRTDLYAYLLASIRLGRMPVETKKHFNRVHQDVIARRATKKAKKRTPPR
ncbi:MAG: hypothetical protein JWM05_113 [Acidimicrobiales bacterium]|nr:hypothetical protein [Acidimicrobiales bacterium]